MTTHARRVYIHDVVELKPPFDKCLEGDDFKGIVSATFYDTNAETKYPELKKGYIMVSLLDMKKHVLLAESKVKVIDRSFSINDNVKSIHSDLSGQSGIVMDMHMKVDVCSLFTDSLKLFDIDTKRLKMITPEVENLSACFGNWAGEVKSQCLQALVRIDENNVCLLDEDDVEIVGVHPDSFFFKYKLSVGMIVKCCPKALKSCFWLVGGYEKGKEKGMVISTEITDATIKWKYHNLNANGSSKEPDCSYRSGMVKILENSFLYSHFTLGELVQFKEGDEYYKGNITEYPVLNCGEIFGQKTTLDILWQDGTISNNVPSLDLIPHDYPDEHDLWPGDFVCLKDSQDQTGLVVSVNSTDRTALVKWYDGNCTSLTGVSENYSIYELQGHPHFSFSIGTTVLLVKEAISMKRYVNINIFFGEAIGVDLDSGLVKVRLLPSNEEKYFAPSLLVCPEDSESSEDSSNSEEDWEDTDSITIDSEATEAVEDTNSSTEEGEVGWNEMNENSDTIPDLLKIVKKSVESVADESLANVSNEKDEFKKFLILDDLPEHHHFNSKPSNTSLPSGRLMKEYLLLEKSLPEDGIWVRTFESRNDLFSAIIVGPKGTPYDGAMFYFDIMLPDTYPQCPPDIFYHSWTGGDKLNPNLYEEGRVCLSLLGTWDGQKTEKWTKQSSLFQLLVSIQGLVLNRNPYFNEAGYDRQIDTPEGISNSLMYNERAFMLSCKTINYVIHHPPPLFKDLIHEYYLKRGGLLDIIKRCRSIISESEKVNGEELNLNLLKKSKDENDFPVKTVSKGCMKMLYGIVELLNKIKE